MRCAYYRTIVCADVRCRCCVVSALPQSNPNSWLSRIIDRIMLIGSVATCPILPHVFHAHIDCSAHAMLLLCVCCCACVRLPSFSCRSDAPNAISGSLSITTADIICVLNVNMIVTTPPPFHYHHLFLPLHLRLLHSLHDLMVALIHSHRVNENIS